MSGGSGIWVDRDGDLWAFGPDGAGWSWERRGRRGWVRGGMDLDEVNGEYGPLIEVPAPPVDPTLIGYIVANEDGDCMPAVDYAGEVRETPDEALEGATEPGDIVVAVHRLPGGDAG